MKNFKHQFFLSILLLLSLSSQSFACGGCRDFALGVQMANTAKNLYDNEENALFQSIEKLNKTLEEQTLKTQENALKENKILLSLEKNININEKEQNFYLKQHNELQSLIDSIKAMK